jgi:hypothetical protein
MSARNVTRALPAVDQAGRRASTRWPRRPARGPGINRPGRRSAPASRPIGSHRGAPRSWSANPHAPGRPDATDARRPLHRTSTDRAARWPPQPSPPPDRPRLSYRGIVPGHGRCRTCRTCLILPWLSSAGSPLGVSTPLTSCSLRLHAQSLPSRRVSQMHPHTVSWVSPFCQVEWRFCLTSAKGVVCLTIG